MIDFDGVPDQTVVNTLYSGQGITFARSDGDSIPAYDWVSISRITTSPNNVIATIEGDFIGGSAASVSLSLSAVFAAPTMEIGAFFGNDLLGFGGYSRTTLEIFDAANVSLGSVFVDTNDNTSVDQFIGLRSTVPFSRAVFSNNGTTLAVVLDDVRFTSVPEPGSLLLLTSGILGLAMFKARIGLRRKD